MGSDLNAAKRWLPVRLALVACVLMTTTAAATAEVRVVVSSKPLHALVASVMGDVGTPTVLVAGAVSPHSYAMKPSDARTANGASVFFRVGESLEPWTTKLVKALPKTVRVVAMQDAPAIKTLARRETGAFEAHDKGHGHDHGAGKGTGAAAAVEDERDPHVWLDPANASAMVDTIATVLGELEPAKAAVFRANGQATKMRLDVLAADLDRELKPLAGRPFVVLHDAYQYFEARFGVMAVGSIAVSPEAAPSARQLAAIRRKIVASGARCVFAEPGMQPKLVAAVVEGTAAKIVLLDPEATQLPPGSQVYDLLMRNLSAGMQKCLGGN